MPSPPDFPALNVQRLTDAVYRSLKERILSRAFAPGHRLKTDELAVQMGVSRTPLKDALNALASEGLVEIIPRKGTFVIGLSATDIAEVFEIRRALELLAAEVLVERVVDEEIVDLRGHLAALEQAGERKDAAGHMKRNLAFHQLFVRLAGNRRLVELYENLGAHIQIGRVHARRANWQDRLRQEKAEHGEILAALEARDRARLVAAVNVHIKRAKESLIQDIKASALTRPTQLDRRATAPAART